MQCCQIYKNSVAKSKLERLELIFSHIPELILVLLGGLLMIENLSFVVNRNNFSYSVAKLTYAVWPSKNYTCRQIASRLLLCPA